MALMTDLQELKATLEIDPNNHAEDKKLLFLVEQVSSLVEDMLNRPGLFYKERTEYYSGSGTSRLLLRSRPVYRTPTIAVRLDDSAFYGAPSDSFAADTALTYGDDFALALDQEDGLTSRSGILLRINDIWSRPSVRQRGYLSSYVGDGHGNIRVVYTGGYTVDNLPAAFRLATNLLVAKLRYLLPVGVEIASESYEERAISTVLAQKGYLASLAWPMLASHRNWSFGGSK